MARQDPELDLVTNTVLAHVAIKNGVSQVGPPKAINSGDPKCGPLGYKHGVIEISASARLLRSRLRFGSDGWLTLQHLGGQSAACSPEPEPEPVESSGAFLL